MNLVKKWWKLSCSILVSSVIILSGCSKDSSDGGGSNNYDRKAMLTDYADGYIIPAYTDMAVKLSTLSSKINEFTNSPDATTLSAARTAFTDAYITWQKVDMLETGPAESVSLRMYANTYPVTISKLEGNISTGGYDLEQFGQKDAQGFAAIDYLLNGIGSDNAAVVAKYTSDVQAAARKQYLKDVIAKTLSKVNTVRDGWAGYRADFINSTGTDAGSSTSKLVNAFVLYYERYLRSGKIGLPAGAMTGVAKPDICEAYYSPDLGKILAVTALQSVKNFYEGKSYDGSTQGKSMYTYLTAIGTKDNNNVLIADLISTTLGGATASLQALPVNIKDGVQTQRTAVLSVYDKLQAGVPLLKVDMVSAFGISITYVDNDGD